MLVFFHFQKVVVAPQLKGERLLNFVIPTNTTTIFFLCRPYLVIDYCTSTNLNSFCLRKFRWWRGRKMPPRKEIARLTIRQVKRRRLVVGAVLGTNPYNFHYLKLSFHIFVCWMVGRMSSVCYNSLKGQEANLLCSYWSTCSIYRWSNMTTLGSNYIHTNDMCYIVWFPRH